MATQAIPPHAGRRLSATAMAELEAAWQEYRATVAASDLSESSQATYIDMANNFLRWLRGDFDPGSRKAPYRIVPDRLKMLRGSARRGCAGEVSSTAASSTGYGGSSPAARVSDAAASSCQRLTPAKCE